MSVIGAALKRVERLDRLLRGEIKDSPRAAGGAFSARRQGRHYAFSYCKESSFVPDDLAHHAQIFFELAPN